MVTPAVVALFAVTVKVSFTGLAAVTDSISNVVLPAESFGVIVNVAVSLAAMEPVVALNVNEAGAPAMLQTTVVDAD
jgi:uncharacterized membrane protein YdfJ with MMPL/SSD domain